MKEINMLEAVPKFLNFANGDAKFIAEIGSRLSPTSQWRGLGDGRGVT
jgi:hypothetical protein